MVEKIKVFRFPINTIIHVLSAHYQAIIFDTGCITKMTFLYLY